MTPRQVYLSPRSSVARVIALTATLMGVMALLVFTAVSYGDDALPDEVVKEAAKQGYERTDRDLEIGKLEKAQKDGSLTKPDADRLKELKDANKRYDDFMDPDPKKNPFPPNKQFKDVVDRARKARAYQLMIESLKKAKAKNSDAGQGIEMWEKALEDLMKGPPPLPPLPPLPSWFTAALAANALPLDIGLASIADSPLVVAVGQSGFVTFTSTIGSVGGLTGSGKGNMTFIGTELIQQQTKRKIKLDDGAHLELKGTRETPQLFWEFAGKFMPGGFGGPAWSELDAQPPSYSSWHAGKDFTLDGFDRTTKFLHPSWKVGVDYRLKLNLTHAYQEVSTDYKIGQDFRVTFNQNPYYVAGLKSGANTESYQRAYMQRGAIDGMTFKWTSWHSPFAEAPMIFNGQISQSGYDDISWQSPFNRFMAYGHVDPGALPLPVPGLDPTSWPITQAKPIPTLHIQRTWMEDK